jgi:hypothetical protein
VRKIGKLIQIIGIVLCVTVFLSPSLAAQTYDCGTYSAGDYGQGCPDENFPVLEQTTSPADQEIETDPAPTSDGQMEPGDDQTQTEGEDSTPATQSYWWIITIAILIILIGLAILIYYRRRHRQGV